MQETPKGILIAVKVTPKANRTEVIGYKNQEICIRIAATPEKGEANAELIHFLSKKLGIAKIRIALVSGEKSRHKKVSIIGITMKEAVEKLEIGTEKK